MEGRSEIQGRERNDGFDRDREARSSLPARPLLDLSRLPDLVTLLRFVNRPRSWHLACQIGCAVSAHDSAGALGRASIGSVRSRTLSGRERPNERTRSRRDALDGEAGRENHNQWPPPRIRRHGLADTAQPAGGASEVGSRLSLEHGLLLFHDQKPRIIGHVHFNLNRSAW